MEKLSQDYLTISPAYGRDYKNKEAAQRDFLGGKDFVMESVACGGGRYCSVRDFEPGTVVNIRYSGMRKAAVVKVI